MLSLSLIDTQPTPSGTMSGPSIYLILHGAFHFELSSCFACFACFACFDSTFLESIIFPRSLLALRHAVRAQQVIIALYW